ncbi:MAG: hypothetical protein E7678_02110 [Ruminococcaceae bacterium]|nr:hypothetical protein [Oscillospiraceae bacterium]
MSKKKNSNNLKYYLKIILIVLLVQSIISGAIIGIGHLINPEYDVSFRFFSFGLFAFVMLATLLLVIAMISEDIENIKKTKIIQYKDYDDLLKSGRYKRKYILNKQSFLISRMYDISSVLVCVLTLIFSSSLFLKIFVCAPLTIFLFASIFYDLLSEQYFVIDKDYIKTVNFFNKTFRSKNHSHITEVKIAKLSEKRVHRKQILNNGEYLILMYSQTKLNFQDYESIRKNKDVFLIFYDTKIHSALTSVINMLKY